jgi:hypothetical protein
MIALLANVWVRRGLAALAIITMLTVAFFLMRAHFISEGKTQGVAAQTQRGSDALEVTHVADRSGIEQQIATMKAQLDGLSSQADTYKQLALNLSKQRAAVPDQVAGMTPAQVDAQINLKLGRLAGDATPYSAADRQKIDACFVDRDLCNQQVDAKSKELTTKAAQLATTQQMYQDLAGYTSKLENTYTELHNETTQPRRSVRCLWLAHCFTPQIKAPDPAKLLRPTAQPVANNK